MKWLISAMSSAVAPLYAGNDEQDCRGQGKMAMDDRQFDTLTRRLSSRRTALTGLLGGVAWLLGRTPGEAGAHNPIPACRKLPDRAQRRVCLRRARAHNRRHRCKPKPAAVMCGGLCGGSAANGCGKRVACPACPPDRTCLASRGCAQTCGLGQPPCPTGCSCTFLEVGSGIPYCTQTVVGACAGVRPGVCAGTAQCPSKHVCTPVQCGPNDTFENRCIPLCPA